MPASSIATDVRAVIKSSLSGVTANVYDFVPAAPMPPFVALVPGTPYMELETIGRNVVRTKLNYLVTCGVANLDNASALDNLEKLTISILAALPAGLELSVVEQPTPVTVGTSEFLVSDIRLSVRYEQTN